MIGEAGGWMKWWKRNMKKLPCIMAKLAIYYGWKGGTDHTQRARELWTIFANSEKKPT